MPDRRQVVARQYRRAHPAKSIRFAANSELVESAHGWLHGFHRAFRKWWYLKNNPFNRIFHSNLKLSNFGYPHLRNPAYGDLEPSNMRSVMILVLMGSVFSITTSRRFHHVRLISNINKINNMKVKLKDSICNPWCWLCQNLQHWLIYFGFLCWCAYSSTMEQNWGLFLFFSPTIWALRMEYDGISPAQGVGSKHVVCSIP